MIKDVILPNKQFFSMNELNQFGLSQYRVSKLIELGKLKKINKQFFENTDYSGEESDFNYVKVYAPKGIVCLLSAAVYYNLTTYIPDSIDVAIPRKSRVSTMPIWPRFCLHYYTDKRYQLGIIKVGDIDNSFFIYDIEKTVVDVVFYKEIVGIDLTKEILKSYLNRNDRNLNKLIEYARQLKCEKRLRQYLEVLV